MASFWSTTAQQSAWNTGKIWGSGASSNYSTSGGGFWEEPTKVATNQKVPTSSKMLAKSQTMGSITTNKGQNAAQKQQQELQQQSKMGKQAPVNLPSAKPLTNNNNKPSGPKPIKSDKKSDDNFSAEFNNWCCKALNNLQAEVDGKYFPKISKESLPKLTFLQSPLLLDFCTISNHHSKSRIILKCTWVSLVFFI